MSGSGKLAPGAPNMSGLRTILEESGRYFLVALAALTLDYGLLVGLTELAHVNYLVSAGVGFSAGLALNYMLSTAFVFRERPVASRWIEAAGFAFIGIAGLALNEGLMKLFVEFGGLGYAIAKIPVAGVGFVFNFGVRRLLLFTKWKVRDPKSGTPMAICPVPSSAQHSG